MKLLNNVVLPTVLAVLLSITCHTAIADMKLVVDGKPNGVLVVESDSPKADHAAKALQSFIERMSGATLPIVHEAQGVADVKDAPGPVRIHVGHTSAAKGHKVPSGFDPSVRDDTFEEEGYVLKTLDDHTLLVAGNNDGHYKGTIFAAYALLERLGCRFYFPGEWGQIVPKQKTIEIAGLDVLSRPDFAVRSIPLSGWVKTTREEHKIYNEWANQIGLGAGRYYPRASDATLGHLLRLDGKGHKQIFEEHPEFYAMGKDGQRHLGRHPMLCMSNEEMFQTVVNNLRLAFEGKHKLPNVSAQWPGSIGAGFSPPDGAPFCYCDDCKQVSANFNYPRYGNSPGRPMMSEQYYRFVARLAREFPDKWINTGAYSLREAPPLGVDLPDNVAIWYAPITSDVLHPGDTKLWRRSQTIQWVKQWRKLTPHVYIYDYTPGMLVGMFVPERDAENMAINTRIYREIDIKGMRREGRKAFMQTWISYYLVAKLLWDADADVEAIKQEFYLNFFGKEAGPHVRAWWEACAQVLVQSPTQAHEDWLINHLYDAKFAAKLNKHVEAAVASTMTDEQRKRVQVFVMIAENFEQYAAMNEAWHEMNWDAAAAAAKRMVDLKVELNKAYSFMISPDHRKNGRAAFARGHHKHFLDMASRTNGTTGDLVAKLPLDMKFTRDPFNEGVINRWFEPAFDTSSWETRNTFYLLEQQEQPLNDRGYFYNGYVWYRGEIDIPAKYNNRELKLYLGGLLNEGWLWVNGQYVGHRPWVIWWTSRGRTAEFDVTPFLKPGQKNTIVIRVLNDPDEAGGVFRRGFIYAPKADTSAEVAIEAKP